MSKKIVTLALLALVAFTSGIAFRFYTALHAKSEDLFSSIEKDIDTSSRQYAELKEQGKFNLLILGEDDVEGSRRSDTILFATVDIDDKNIRVLSLPRDTRVEIPGHGTQKLNHSFAFGGVDLLRATVEKFLGKPILYYVMVDYNSFPAMVDIMGGVEIDVQKRMRYIDRAGKLDINIQPGLQKMDGKTALHFVRFRKDALGDIGRVQRQQQFIKSLLKKVYDPRVIVRIPELAAQTVKLIKTDMSPTLAVQLAGFMKNELGRERIFFSTLHGKPETIDNLSYWIGDTNAADAFLSAPIEALISGDVALDRSSRYANISLAYTNALDDSPMKKAADSSGDAAKINLTKDEVLKMIRSMPESVAVLNGTGKAGIGQEIASRLQQLGIDVIHTGNAKHFDYQTSNVIYPVNTAQKYVQTSKTLGKLLNVPNNLIRPNKQAFYASIIIGHDYQRLIKELDSLIKISGAAK